MPPLHRLAVAAVAIGAVVGAGGLGCGDTTGVFLTVRGAGVVADQLRVTAHAASGTATHELAGKGAGGLVALPVTLEAVMPVTVGNVTFTALALRNGNVIASGTSATIIVPPHQVVDGEIDLVAGTGNHDGGGAASDAGTLGDGGTIAGAYSRTLTIPRGKVNAQDGQQTLSDYPLLVSITDPGLRTVAAGGHVARGDGSDLRFIAPASTCAMSTSCILDHELEHYDGNGGVLIAWVRVPRLDTAAAPNDTILTLAYGNPSPPGQPSARRVWDPSFVGVWHLGGDARDSTGAHDGAATGTTTVTGKVGSALFFDGAGAWVDIADSAAFDFGLGADFTISMWMLSSQGAVAASPHLLSKSTASQGYDLVLHGANTSDAWSGVIDSGGTSYVEHGRTNVADGAWHLVTLVRQANSLVAYEDGAAASPTAITSGDLAGTLALRLGARAGATATQLYQGNEDEVRVSSIARGPDWILTDFASQSAPASFIVVGAEVAP